MAHLAVLGGDLAVANFDGTHVGVGDAPTGDRIERLQGEIFHRGVINPPSLSCSLDATRGNRVE